MSPEREILKTNIISKSYYFSKTDMVNCYYLRESFSSGMSDKIRKYTKSIFLTLNRGKKSRFYHNTIQVTQLSHSKSQFLCYRSFKVTALLVKLSKKNIWFSIWVY